jgi:type I restriction enzyme, S subunit
MQYEKIGNIAKFINGYPFKPSDWKSEGQKIIRIQNLNDINKPFNCTDTEVPEKYIVHKGDILVSWSASLGVFEWDYDEIALLNQHIFKVVFDKQKVFKSYFKHAIKDCIDGMTKYTHGSTMKHIVKEDFDNTKIPLPSLEEQKQIADTLDKADALRQKRKQSIQLLDDYLKSVFYDMFGDPVKNEKGWEIKKLKDLIKIERNSILPENIEDGMKYIDLESIEKETGKIRNFYTVSKGFIKSNKFIFSKNHILYGKLRPYLNKVALPDFEGICSTDILPILTIKNNSVKYFISFLLRQPIFVNYANERSSGANLPRVNIDTIYKFDIIAPPLSLQNQFANIVERVEQTKSKMEESLKEIDNLFNSLINKFFRK